MIKIRRVKEGDSITRPMGGGNGYFHVKAPHDGLAIRGERGDEIYVPSRVISMFSDDYDLQRIDVYDEWKSE